MSVVIHIYARTIAFVKNAKLCDYLACVMQLTKVVYQEILYMKIGKGWLPRMQSFDMRLSAFWMYHVHHKKQTRCLGWILHTKIWGHIPIHFELGQRRKFSSQSSFRNKCAMLLLQEKRGRILFVPVWIIYQQIEIRGSNTVSPLITNIDSTNQIKIVFNLPFLTRLFHENIIKRNGFIKRRKSWSIHQQLSNSHWL